MAGVTFLGNILIFLSFLVIINRYVFTDLIHSFQNKFLPAETILYVDLVAPIKKKTGVIAKKTTLYKNIILNNDFIDTAFDKRIIEEIALSNYASAPVL